MTIPRWGKTRADRLTGSGAATPGVRTTFITGAGIDVTLADGDLTLDGFVQTFIVVSGSGTLTPSNMGGFEINWAAAAQFSIVWDETAGQWRQGVLVDATFDSAALDCTQDATSMIYCPADITEWGNVCAVAGVSDPSFGWDMQDASGNLTASVGAVDLATEGARQDFQQTVTGWTRKGAKSRGDGWLTSDASFPDVSTTSMMMLVYARQYTSGGGDNDLLWLGDLGAGNYERLRVTSTDKLKSVNDAGTASSAGSGNESGQVRPYILQINRASSTCEAFSDTDAVSVAIGGPNSKGAYILGSLAGDECYFLIGAVWTGAAAEMTNAQIKTLLETLGWTIPWS